MEAQDRQLLEDHRAMFRQSVEVEQLLPFLLAGEAITTMDITSINAHVSREGKVNNVTKYQLILCKYFLYFFE